MKLTIDELRAKRDSIAHDLKDAQARARGANAPSGIDERIENLHVGLSKAQQELDDRHGELEQLRHMGADPRQRESPIRSTAQALAASTPQSAGSEESRGAAMRALDAAYERSEINSADGERLVELIHGDAQGADRRYLTAIADPHYATAFLKRALSPEMGPNQILTPEESSAMERVGQAMTERSMIEGEGSKGGFAVPFALDPTIHLTNDGAVSPLRDLASVQTIATSEWRGISSTGATAAFSAEGTEVGDGSPTLAQPKIAAEKAQGFVPFSIELGQDWPSVQEELARLMQDAKAVLEAAKFAAGSGNDEPAGIVTGASKVVETATGATLAIADVYAMSAALPPRYQPNATWQTSLLIANAIYRFAGPGSEEPSPFNPNRDRLLLKPWFENSALESVLTGGQKIAIYGDVKAGFKIIDRIGATVEIVPHLFGENGRPTGERGLYFYWRVGSGVVNANALRVLKVKAP